MKLKDLQNEGALDRFIRLFVAETFFLGAYFWTGGIWQIILYALGIISLVTSLTGFCALYKILRIKTTTAAPLSVYAKIGSLIVFLIVAIAGSYYSAFFTKKLFLDDYNRMNTYYKQTLFYTGQEQRDAAIANYDNLVNQYSAFYEKYTIYHPYAIRSDSQFNSDIGKVSTTITSLKETVYSGSLQEAHLSLESVRPLFQDILKRNNFSLLAISLVDFHDAMEKILTA
ncbi:MAG: DUF2892 domain-containing protein, partial [Candidatus Pacebacteria bacterium]|nr:DUF2892 domain-containing protein [Candidatus Paceibacterota bacterium]